MQTGRNLFHVTLALFLSYGLWGLIRLNGWTAGFRQHNLYYMYQTFFLVFLVIFFWGYLLFGKEKAFKPLPSACFGLGVGYIASLLAMCFWPLLAPNGWHKFIHMGWNISELFKTGIVIAGWLNGLIMAGVLWLIKSRNDRLRLTVTVLVICLFIFRLIVGAELLLHDLLPPF
jgi:glucan phosphoethanolaminetransferase (alkaline phosphatase superfamily)